jgi:hypothetical protein
MKNLAWEKAVKERHIVMSVDYVNVVLADDSRETPNGGRIEARLLSDEKKPLGQMRAFFPQGTISKKRAVHVK